MKVREQDMRAIKAAGAEEYKAEQEKKLEWDKRLRKLKDKGYKFCPLLQGTCVGKACVSYNNSYGIGVLPYCQHFGGSVVDMEEK